MNRRARLTALTLSLLTLLQSSVSAGQAGPHSTPQLGEIDELIGQEKLDESLQRLRRLQLERPDDPEVLSRLGAVYFKQGNYFEALEPLRKALDSDSSHRQATQYLGSSLYFLGRLEEAIPYLEKSLEWFPDNINFLNILELTYIQTEQPEKARGIVARLYNIPGDSPQAHLITGILFRQQDVWDPALAELQTALKKNPSLPMAHLYIGEIYYSQRKLEEALREFATEIELNPAMWMGYHRTGEILFEQGKYEDAVSFLQRVISLNRYFAGPYLILGQIHLRENRLELALETLKRAVELDYSDPNTHYLLSRALLKAGQREEAEKELEISNRFRRQQ